MSGWVFEVFMILSQIAPVTAPPQPRSISEAILPTAPPSPLRLLPAARIGRLTGIALPAPQFDRTPFARRVELPLAQFWSGRLTVSGFHSTVSYSAASLGDPHFSAIRLAPGSAGAQPSRSYGLRITFSSGCRSGPAFPVHSTWIGCWTPNTRLERGKGHACPKWE